MENDNTQERILDIATEVFYKKGLGGARMQEIADKSGISKAMLHYYFTSKEQLFQTVFQRTFGLYMGCVSQLLSNKLPLKEKLALFIDEITDLLQHHPFIPVFIIHELNQNPGRVSDLFIGKGAINFEKFRMEVRKEIRMGNLKNIQPEQLFTDLISLTVLPFISQSILGKIFNKNKKEYKLFLAERKNQLKKQWLDNL